MCEFNRMSHHFHWERGGDETQKRDGYDNETRKLLEAQKQEARRAFKKALTREFNDIYGTDINDIRAWTKLCRVLSINPIPEKLKECRAVGFLSTTSYRFTDFSTFLMNTEGCPGDACQSSGSG